jgi:glutamate-ammonia-ligase adenylyltransferase
MATDQSLGRRAGALIEASRTLAELLERDPFAAELLNAERPLPDAAGYVSLMTAAFAADGFGGLRAERRRRLLEIAARDLVGELPLQGVGHSLAKLADACLGVAVASIEGGDGLAVIGMGKLGGDELNYSSDIDLMFVGDPAFTTKTAETLVRELGDVAPEGQAYRIDLNLRPEGRSGALVRSVEGYLEYYKRWAKPWEFQALIKARACAGNKELGDALVEQTRPLVYSTEISSERIADIRKTKARVEEHAQRSARRGSSDRDDVKLGPGGIRDIEFSVQLLQLVHGGTDDSVRSPTTLIALQALVEGGYVADDDGAAMSVAYQWLRNVEHRLQLWQERQVHHLPGDEDQLSRLAHTMGFKDTPAAGATERFLEAHRGVLADVRSRFERLFYRPMIEALADPVGPRLSEDAIKGRLRVLGFRDVDRAARTLSNLVAGTSRRAKLFKVLTPALLRYLAAAPLPDDGLFAFLVLGEALEGRLDALNGMRDNPPGIEFLATVLGSGRLLGEVLVHVPEEVAAIADPRGPGGPKPRERLVREAVASLEWREPEKRLDGLRRFKRKEMMRVAMGDLASTADTPAVGAWLSDLADACLEAALEHVDMAFTVIGMGKLGGRELNYSSDIDVMFVFEGDVTAADRVGEELVRAIGEVTPEGQAFRIDPALRPEGKSGPLVRSLESYAEYYARWAHPWEFQALIKARPAAGDAGLGERFMELVRPYAFPSEVPAASLAEIRHLKARMERERIPRGVDPRRHFKLGPGSLSDVEFAVQIMQMTHGHRLSELQHPNTFDAIENAPKLDLITEVQSRRLIDGYSFLTRLRNRLFFIAGRPVDVLPTKPEELEAIGVAMGFADQPRQELEQEFLRVTRRVRQVCEPLIYG